MCGQFFISGDDIDYEAIRRRAAEPASIESAKTGAIFPGDSALAVAMGGTPRVMRWGFPPYAGGRLMINARSETAAERPMFRAVLERGRCLIPATCYYEWQHSDGGRTKKKYSLRPEGTRIFYLAGLYRTFDGCDEPRFVVITREASEAVSVIHSRMPLIIPYPNCADWLREGADARALLGGWVDSPVLELLA